jgi:dual specificity tyrosine-phosphorylation-regulated kinase 2/3/4
MPEPRTCKRRTEPRELHLASKSVHITLRPFTRDDAKRDVLHNANLATTSECTAGRSKGHQYNVRPVIHGTTPVLRQRGRSNTGMGPLTVGFERKFEPSLPPLSVTLHRNLKSSKPAHISNGDAALAVNPAVGTITALQNGKSMYLRGFVKDAVRSYWPRLSAIDQSSIFCHKYVWYLPLRDDSPQSESMTESTTSSRENDDAIVIRRGAHVAFRFEMSIMLGEGSFGRVVQCYDHKLGREVAVKLIKRDRRYASQVEMEIAALELARKNRASRIVHMLEHFTFREHVCIVFELLGVNLYEILASRHFKGMKMRFVRSITNQMINALCFLKRVRMVHCDIKPENILVEPERNFRVKLIDFGSACFKGKSKYTYIQSRFYRAPEVMLGLHYSHPVDMWSFACVLVEVACGAPLFVGEDEALQLKAIASIIGDPPSYLLQKSEYSSVSRVKCERVACVATNRTCASKRDEEKQKKDKSVRATKSLLPGITNVAFDCFIRSAFEWDPAKRLTPEAAAKHSFLKDSSTQEHDHSR